MSMVTSPGYNNAADASAWFWGLNHSLSAGGVYVGHTGTTAGRWGIHTMPLSLQPGVYYLTEVGIQAGFTEAADLDRVYFAIFQDNGGALTPIMFGDGTTYVDMTAEIQRVGGSGADIGPTTVASKAFTVESGKSYQLAWGFRKAGTTTGRPGVMRMTDTHGPQGLTCYSNLEQTIDFPASYVGTANTSNELPRGYIKFTTPMRRLFSTSYSAAKDVLIPRRTNGDFCIKFRHIEVANGENFTCGLYADNNGSNNLKITLVHDMGATNQITCGGQNIALDASEADELYDWLFELRADSKYDLFHVNKTTGRGPLGAADFATKSHACGSAAARGSEYTHTAPAPYYLKMSGTAAVATIEVGWEPLVILGDSQCTRTLEGGISSTNRLGYYLPTAFTYQRIYWPAWIAGSVLTADNGVAQTAAYLRYKSATPGQGDLCEMSTPVLVVGGIGVNDISTQIGSTAANRNKTVARMAYRLGELLYDWTGSSRPVILIGLPPYSSSGAADEAEAKAIKDQWNAALEGLAMGVRCPFINPWWDMVLLGQAEDAVPGFNPKFTEDGGLHYSSTGAAAVAALVAECAESGYVHGLWKRTDHFWRCTCRASAIRGEGTANLSYKYDGAEW